MASVYPGSLDALSTAHADGVSETIHASTMNDDADAINKIELELGINPSGIYVDVLTRLNTLETVSFNTQSGTTYTLVLGDASKCVVRSNAAANTLTIPPNSSVAFAIGTEIKVRQGLAGATTIVAGSGVTLVNPFSSFVLAGANAEAKLLKTATNTWSLNGEVA